MIFKHFEQMINIEHLNNRTQILIVLLHKCCTIIPRLLHAQLRARLLHDCATIALYCNLHLSVARWWHDCGTISVSFDMCFSAERRWTSYSFVFPFVCFLKSCHNHNTMFGFFGSTSKRKTEHGGTIVERFGKNKNKTWWPDCGTVWMTNIWTCRHDCDTIANKKEIAHGGTMVARFRTESGNNRATFCFWNRVTIVPLCPFIVFENLQHSCHHAFVFVYIFEIVTQSCHHDLFLKSCRNCATMLSLFCPNLATVAPPCSVSFFSFFIMPQSCRHVHFLFLLKSCHNRATVLNFFGEIHNKEKLNTVARLRHDPKTNEKKKL